MILFNKFQVNKETIFKLFFALGIILIIYLVGKQISPDTIKLWTQKAGVFGPAVIFTISILTAVIAPLSGTPLMLVGFTLYGPEIVFLFTFSGLISAGINFFIAKKLGRPYIEKLVGKANIAKVDELTQSHGITSLAILRIFLGGLNDFISYAMGLTNMKFKTYYVVTAVSFIPGTMFWYFIALNSSSTLAFLIWSIIFTTALGFVFAILRMARKLAKRTQSL